jgi:transcriptional regulator with XRE-family HTH domain
MDPTGRYDTLHLDGRLVKRRRLSRKLTQHQLADLSRVSRGWISVIEATDDARVSKDTAAKLTGALGCSASDLQRRPGDEDSSGFTFGSPISTAKTAEEWESILSDMELLAKRIRRFVSEQRRSK